MKNTAAGFPPNFVSENASTCRDTRQQCQGNQPTGCWNEPLEQFVHYVRRSQHSPAAERRYVEAKNEYSGGEHVGDAAKTPTTLAAREIVRSKTPCRSTVVHHRRSGPAAGASLSATSRYTPAQTGATPLLKQVFVRPHHKTKHPILMLQNPQRSTNNVTPPHLKGSRNLAGASPNPSPL